MSCLRCPSIENRRQKYIASREKGAVESHAINSDAARYCIKCICSPRANIYNQLEAREKLRRLSKREIKCLRKFIDSEFAKARDKILHTSFLSRAKNAAFHSTVSIAQLVATFAFFALTFGQKSGTELFQTAAMGSWASAIYTWPVISSAHFRTCCENFDKIENKRSLESAFKCIEEDLDFAEKRITEEVSLQSWWSNLEDDVFF